jgi:FkbM family methyltransferase
MMLSNILKYQSIKRIQRNILSLIKSNPRSYFLEDHKFNNRPLHFYKTKIGNYYVPADAVKDNIVIQMKKGKIFEPEIVDVANRYVQKGTTVLDVGANLGQMSLLFSKFTGEKGQVLSFEADDFIYKILKKNIDANFCKNIQAILGAVYDCDDKKMFYPVQDFKRFGSYGSYGINPSVKEGRSINTVTIDRLNITNPISFMKVDVQGSDLFALRGAVETIKRNRMPIIFEFEQQFQKEFNTTFQDYINFIQSITYEVKEVVNKINYLIVPKS